MVVKKQLTIILFLPFLLMFCSASKEKVGDVEGEVKDSAEIISDVKNEKQEQKITEINETFDEVEAKLSDEEQAPEIFDVEFEESDASDTFETVEVNTNFEVPECKHIPEGKKVCKKWRSSWVKKKVFEMNSLYQDMATFRFYTGFKALIDEKGKIHLVYFEGLPEDTYKNRLMYATNKTGVWESEVIDGVFQTTDLTAAYTFDFVLDSSTSSVHLIYSRPLLNPTPQEPYGWSYVYGTNKGGFWKIESVHDDYLSDFGASFGWDIFKDFIDVKLGKNKEVYAFYPGTYYVLFAKKSAGKWNKNLIDKGIYGLTNPDNFYPGFTTKVTNNGIVAGDFFLKKDGRIYGILGTLETMKPPIYFESSDADLSKIKGCYIESVEKFKEDCNKDGIFYTTASSCNSVKLSSGKLVSLCIFEDSSSSSHAPALFHTYFLYIQKDQCNFIKLKIVNDIDSIVFPLLPYEYCDKNNNKFYRYFKPNGAVDNCDRVFYSFQFEKPMFKEVNSSCEQLDPNVLAFVVTDGTEVTAFYVPEIKAISYNTNLIIDNDQNLHLIYIEPPDDPIEMILSPTKLNIIHAVKECEEYY